MAGNIGTVDTAAVAGSATGLVREIRWNPADKGPQTSVDKEWLVTNGLGGYASGTLSGSLTRRYHALLVAALPTPFGRTVMFNYLWEQLRWPDGRVVSLAKVTETAGGREFDSSQYLTGFWLEEGLPVWHYEVEGLQIEKRVLMCHLQNTTHINYRMLSNRSIRLELRPMVAFRLHEAPVSHPIKPPYSLHALGDRFEIVPGDDLPPLRLFLYGADKAMTVQPATFDTVHYSLEHKRGYEACGDLWTPGYFRVMLSPETPGTLVASTESWATIGALEPDQAREDDHQRRKRLLDAAKRVPNSSVAAERVRADGQV